MKLIRNSGNERVIDRLREWLAQGASVDLMSPTFSVHAFAEVRELIEKAEKCRLLLGDEAALADLLFGGPADIVSRGQLQDRWLARLIEIAGEVINRTKRLALVDGIKYQQIGAESYSPRSFSSRKS